MRPFISASIVIALGVISLLLLFYGGQVYSGLMFIFLGLGAYFIIITFSELASYKAYFYIYSYGQSGRTAAEDRKDEDDRKLRKDRGLDNKLSRSFRISGRVRELWLTDSSYVIRKGSGDTIKMNKICDFRNLNRQRGYVRIATLNFRETGDLSNALNCYSYKNASLLFQLLNKKIKVMEC
jgi:hypothetical protein